MLQSDAIGLEPLIPATPKGAAMRQRLMNASARVFARKGYEATRVEDIVKSARTSYGNFYRHFRNKDEVLLAVLRPMLDAIYVASKRRAGRSIRVTEAEFVENTVAYLRIYSQHRKLLRVMREAAARGEKATILSLYIAERTRFVKRTVTWLARLQVLGALGRDLDPDMAAEVLGATMEQVAYMKFDLAEKDPSDAEIQYIGSHCAMIWYRGVFGID